MKAALEEVVLFEEDAQYLLFQYIKLRNNLDLLQILEMFVSF